MSFKFNSASPCCCHTGRWVFDTQTWCLPGCEVSNKQLRISSYFCNLDIPEEEAARLAKLVMDDDEINGTTTLDKGKVLYNPGTGNSDSDVPGVFLECLDSEFFRPQEPGEEIEEEDFLHPDGLVAITQSFDSQNQLVGTKIRLTFKDSEDCGGIKATQKCYLYKPICFDWDGQVVCHIKGNPETVNIGYDYVSVSIEEKKYSLTFAERKKILETTGEITLTSGSTILTDKLFKPKSSFLSDKDDGGKCDNAEVERFDTFQVSQNKQYYLNVFGSTGDEKHHVGLVYELTFYFIKQKNRNCHTPCNGDTSIFHDYIPQSDREKLAEDKFGLPVRGWFPVRNQDDFWYALYLFDTCGVPQPGTARLNGGSTTNPTLSYRIEEGLKKIHRENGYCSENRWYPGQPDNEQCDGETNPYPIREEGVLDNLPLRIISNDEPDIVLSVYSTNRFVNWNTLRFAGAKYLESNTPKTRCQYSNGVWFGNQNYDTVENNYTDKIRMLLVDDPVCYDYKESELEDLKISSQVFLLNEDMEVIDTKEISYKISDNPIVSLGGKDWTIVRNTKIQAAPCEWECIPNDVARFPDFPPAFSWEAVSNNMPTDLASCTKCGVCNSIAWSEDLRGCQLAAFFKNMPPAEITASIHANGECNSLDGSTVKLACSYEADVASLSMVPKKNDATTEQSILQNIYGVTNFSGGYTQPTSSSNLGGYVECEKLLSPNGGCFSTSYGENEPSIRLCLDSELNPDKITRTTEGHYLGFDNSFLYYGNTEVNERNVVIFARLYYDCFCYEDVDAFNNHPQHGYHGAAKITEVWVIVGDTAYDCSGHAYNDFMFDDEYTYVPTDGVATASTLVFNTIHKGFELSYYDRNNDEQYLYNVKNDGRFEFCNSDKTRCKCEKLNGLLGNQEIFDISDDEPYYTIENNVRSATNTVSHNKMLSNNNVAQYTLGEFPPDSLEEIRHYGTVYDYFGGSYRKEKYVSKVVNNVLELILSDNGNPELENVSVVSTSPGITKCRSIIDIILTP